LDEFLAKATLASTEFTAERLTDFRLIENATNCSLPTRGDISSSLELQKKYSHRLLIPRRPSKRLWETPEQLNALENENFLEWRKSIAELQEVDGLVLTPFERNLELWRQLWRVIERSDIVVQIVDARNPLLFRNADLESYVKECDPAKHNIILINKADLLTDRQIDLWRKWFLQNNIDVIFWSALEEQKQQSKLESLEEQEETLEEQGNDDGDQAKTPSESESGGAGSDGGIPEHGQILIAYLKRVGRAASVDIASNRLVVGMVGYPNVGKSSTINRILGIKKVSTSSTPGKTRHLQTVIIDNQTCSAFGFMGASGVPDCSRAARLILKEVVNGRLKWVASPPSVEQECFDQMTYPVEGTGTLNRGVVLLQQLEKRNLVEGTSTMDKTFDRQFFCLSQGAAHVRTARQGVHSDSTGRDDKKHHNKGKKEKGKLCVGVERGNRSLKMGKIMKTGKVVLVLGGRFAGRKAIIVKAYDDGSADRAYGHALIAGIDKYPKSVTKRLGKKKLTARSKLRPFVGIAGYSNLLPTRYSVDIPLDKSSINKDVLKEPGKKRKARLEVKSKFEERYKTGKNKWFFTKLRF
uniref:60S ribosomal protein L27 n=1 Tax=Anisakis simplex TaxID=6269 RepID=A0A0M3K1E5_ANISI